MVAVFTLLSVLTPLAPSAFADTPFEYVVQPGDTLWDIAVATGTNVEALVKANRISDPSIIRAGQKLALSGDGSDPAGPDPGASPEPAQVTKVPRVPHPPIRGIYMTYFSAASQEYRSHIFDLLDSTSVNAVVIDVKGDRGYVAFPVQIALAQEIGAQDYLTLRDIAGLMASFKARQVYTIARIVAFKDNPLASARPDLAVHDRRTGEIWTDNEGLAWTDPFQPEVWDYNIAIAVEASQQGFDEVQFDYVRFPTDGNVDGAVFSQPSTQETRQSAIQGFLAKARQALRPLGVKLGIDTFGYTAWRDDDMGIGQRLEDLAPLVDVICPMVYPSTFGSGIPDYTYAVAYPYEIVYYSLNRALDRVGPTGVEIRPWLQDFPDYAFDRRKYTAADVLAQMHATYDAGATGWMLWDPRVQYTRAALGP